jgi:IclR family mhp operon transcriptional activator
LAILAELSAGGPSSVQALAKKTGLNRTTCYRLLETLQFEGYVVADDSRGHFSLTPQVRRLSEGMSTRDLFSQAALPAMFSLMKKVKWPSDFAVFDVGWLVIRESTHPFSPFSVHRAMIGRRRSLLRSSLGRALLTAAEPELRRELLEITASFNEQDASLARDRSYISRLVAKTLEDGYGSSVDEIEGGISAIALAVGAGSSVIGCLNLVFFSSSMPTQVAAQRYLPFLRKTVEEIEDRWRASSEEQSVTWKIAKGADAA